LAKRHHDSVDIQIGARIRNLRLQRKFSQSELGALVGVTFQQIQKYEKGANQVAPRMLVKLAGALKVSVSAIFEAAAANGKAASDASAIDRATQRSAVELIDAFQAIGDPELKKSITRTVELIREYVAQPAGKRSGPRT